MPCALASGCRSRCTTSASRPPSPRARADPRRPRTPAPPPCCSRTGWPAMPERTPEERERDRLEREAKRLAREQRNAPKPPADPPVSRQVGKKRITEPEEAASPPPPTAAPPSATGREWRREAGAPDPDPPNVRRVGAEAPR